MSRDIETIEEFIEVFGNDIYTKLIEIFQKYSIRLSSDNYRKFDKQLLIFKDKMIHLYKKELSKVDLVSHINKDSKESLEFDEVLSQLNSVIDKRVLDISDKDVFDTKFNHSHSAFNSLLFNLYSLLLPACEQRKVNVNKLISLIIDKTFKENPSWFPDIPKSTLSYEGIVNRLKAIRQKVNG